MKKTSTFFRSLVICVLLSACNAQGGQPPVIPSNTPKPSATIEPTQTKIQSTRTPNATQTPVPTPTVTIIPPYPTKQVLLDYDVSGNHSTFDERQIMVVGLSPAGTADRVKTQRYLQGLRVLLV